MSLLVRLAIYLGLTALVLGTIQYQKNKYDEARRDEGRAEVQQKWDADKAERVRAFAKLMTDYVTAQQDADRLQKEKEDARKVRENEARQRAAALPRVVRDMRIPLVAGVLNDGVPADAGSASTAPASGGPAVGATSAPASTDTSVGLWTEWSIKMRDDLYATCVNKLVGLQKFYLDLLSKQQKGAKP